MERADNVAACSPSSNDVAGDVAVVPVVEIDFLLHGVLILPRHRLGRTAHRRNLKANGSWTSCRMRQPPISAGANTEFLTELTAAATKAR